MLIARIIAVGILSLVTGNADGAINGSSEIAGNQTDQEDQAHCCVLGSRHFHSIVHTLSNVTSNTIVNLVSDTVLTSVVILQNLDNITIIGRGNPVVNCKGIGAMKFDSCNNVTIKGVSLEECSRKSAYPGIEFYNSSNIVIDTCSFHHSPEQAVVLKNVSGKVYFNKCHFTHNTYNHHGAAIHYTASPEQSIQVQLVINNCDFALNGPAESVIYIKGSKSVEDGLKIVSVLQYSSFIQNQGVPIYISHTSLILNKFVSFKDNIATAGGGLYSCNSIVTLDDRCIFHNNTAGTNGGAIYQTHSKIFFRNNAVVTFKINSAVQSGGAIYSKIISTISFEDKSAVTFNGNSAVKGRGGAVYSKLSSCVQFDDYSKVTFHNNRAIKSSGGAVGCAWNSCVLFRGNSRVSFNKNNAKWGGAVVEVFNSNILFNDYTRTEFDENKVTHTGGAIQCNVNSNISFGAHSMVAFDGNVADLRGGGVGFGDNFNNDTFKSCLMKYYGNTRVTFRNNTAEQGGAIRTSSDSWVTFTENSSLIFDNNTATVGGALHTYNSSVLVEGNTMVKFISNSATAGGAVYSDVGSKISFDETSIVSFHENMARLGGTLYAYNSTVSFNGLSPVTFDNNTAEVTGGAIDITRNSYIHFYQYSRVLFINNRAIYSSGGAVSANSESHIILHGDTTATFSNNIAKHGGAVSIVQSSISFGAQSLASFENNIAGGNGGAIHLSDNYTATFYDDSEIIFSNNSATAQGGSIYGEITDGFEKEIILNTTGVHFYNNTAMVGDAIYIHVPASCDESCLNKSVVLSDVTSSTYKQYIKTPHNKLVLHDPATCVDNDPNCGEYLLTNIMLGQDIIIDVCVLDYFNQPAGPTQFMVNSNDRNHYINGSSTKVLTSCDILQGISVIGDKVTTASNFSMTFASHNGGNQYDLKIISVKLITELSACHPGFYYDNTTKRCVCYNDNDIITCSGSTSLIRRGYWFGMVNNISTATVCPNNYCNFTCCETTNGFYELSPARMNQCMSHRSGTACGSCKEGYTLSFDSIECVSVDNCTTGETVLVVTIAMIYWIVIIIIVFVVTCYHVGIGYLYAITYYYSILDIILSKNLYQSKGLFVTIINISSLVKITPQFLGQFCLVRNMSGIDQQFIHYIHPLAVSIIVIIICQSARISRRFSSFISRGIIRTVCFLMLLSYTSVATTSLLLLRSLTFDNVEKVYTYLSPDIKYCHGRHLPYFVVAVLCTIVIVIGLPLLLLLEPFLNQKINFTRVKPLLDQFQGCYKDKYRCFAAYYMVCRLVIIVIIIANDSNSDLSQLLLIFSSVVLAFIPIKLNPYKHKILYTFDGLILQLVVLATLIPLADKVSHRLSTATIITVIILPLIFFIALELIVHKQTIKDIAAKITSNFKTKPLPTVGVNNEATFCEIGIIIDDTTRKNATICEISSPLNINDGAIHYRESFMEIMDHIED